jgi:hypothetical protein
MTQPVSYQVPAHPSGLDMRTQLNTIVLAILGDNCGPGEPAEHYPGMMWGDTTANRLRRRTNANDGWIDIGPLDDFLGDVRKSVTDMGTKKVNKAGDVMTGALTVPYLILQNGSYAPRIQVDTTATGVCGFVNQAGTAWNLTSDDAGNVLVRARLTVNGVANITGRLTLGRAAELALNGSATMYLRYNNSGTAQMEWVNNAYTAVIATMDDTGNLSCNGQVWAGTGNGRLYANGEIYGTLWGGVLSSWLNTYKANKGGAAATNNVQIEIGPLVKPNTGPLDAGSPWVMCGVRVGGWVGPSGDCVGQLFTRYTQVIQQ